MKGAGHAGSLPARVARLYLGLAAFGVSLALMVQSRPGLSPWTC